MSNYSYPITTFCNWIAVIGHLRCARVNQLHLNGFFFRCFPPTFRLIDKNPRCFEYKRVHIDFLISRFVIDAIYKQLNFVSYNSGLVVLVHALRVPI